MKKILITGIEGFASRHLCEALKKEYKDVSLTGTYFVKPEWDVPAFVDLIKMDVTSSDEVMSVYREKAPFDTIFHLAGLSSVGLSWKNPALYNDTNVKGTLHLLEAVKEDPSKPRFFFVSSSEVYGSHMEEPVSEEAKPSPENPYAVTKLAAEYFVLNYGAAYDIPVTIARPVPHVGPGQRIDFAVMSFCAQACQMKKQKAASPFISVGNIDVRKEYMDVRDVANAYVTIARKSGTGEIYNISPDNHTTLREIIKIIQRTLSLDLEIRQEPDRIRPYDPDSNVISNAKIKRLGWSPSYSIEDSIQDILNSLTK